jgi:hypothetical protein
MCGTRAYWTWNNMKQRCRNPNHRRFGSYGKRGIRVCDDWLTFALFFADMGPPPDGLSIDRIDNDGGYRPGNCRWADASTQAVNQRPRRRKPKTKRAAIMPTHYEEPPF